MTITAESHEEDTEKRHSHWVAGTEVELHEEKPFGYKLAYTYLEIIPTAEHRGNCFQFIEILFQINRIALEGLRPPEGVSSQSSLPPGQQQNGSTSFCLFLMTLCYKYPPPMFSQETECSRENKLNFSPLLSQKQK